MTLLVLKPGALTTVQDAGRTGFRHLGVGAGGALDAFSARVANLLVGNGDAQAVLEITLAGPRLRFERGARIALTGATIDAYLGPQRIALSAWRWAEVPAGMELHMGACRDGARAYLAIAGGFGTPPVMGSRATDVRGNFGGVEGRALRAGDRLAFDGEHWATGVPPWSRTHGNDSCAAKMDDIGTVSIARCWIDSRPDLDLSQPARAHVMPGADALQSPDVLFAAAWRVAAASDRQGLRLDGPVLAVADTRERISAPVAPGAVQLPPDGRPIVLLGEAQTVGGYPVIGHVARADLPRLAQCRPGDTLRFAPIDREGALARSHAQMARIERMRIATLARVPART